MAQHSGLLIKTLHVLSKAWFTLAILFILTGYALVWYTQGFAALQEILSPFNITNIVAVIVTLLPGFGLKMLAGKLENKQVPDENIPSRDND